MAMSQIHETYIRRTFELARMARGIVSPNPLVGCVVVKDGLVIGEGYHRGPGELHAEPDALKNLDHDQVASSTLYCNLEPCCHTNKRTPPCTSLLLDKKPGRIVISNLDPNPEVTGKGVEILRNAGIEVITGVLEKDGSKLNEVFFKNIVTKLPFVHLKIAQTLDGKMCSSTGSSQWITDEQARKVVHQWRNDVDAVCIGAGTLRADDPSLTPRMAEVKNKDCAHRIVLTGKSKSFDSKLQLMSDEYKNRTTFIDGSNLKDALTHMSALGITSILVEAGPKISSSFLNSGLVDRLSVFIAPKIMGNGEAFYVQAERTQMDEARNLKDVEIEIIGEQVLMTGRT